MAGLENQSSESEKQKTIPGFRGLECLDKIENLKKGAFREFLNKVTAIRGNPEELKKVTEKLEKLDNDSNLSPDQKKEQLRSLPKEELFAVIGKDIELGEKGMQVTLDFGKLQFAEQAAIGAGHLLPANVSKVQFGEGSSTRVAKRLPGTRGAEYRTEKDRYMSSYTNTKLFIKYEDILPCDEKQLARAEEVEKKYDKQREDAIGKTHEQQGALRAEQPAAPTSAPQESRDTLPSHTPIFIGDSQVEGLRGALSKKGILAVDFRGLRIEAIAACLKDPSKIDQYYTRGSQQTYKEGVKGRVAQFQSQIRNTDTIIFQCGGNNIVAGDSLEKMQRKIKNLIATVRELNPSAKIFIGLLIPPTESSKNVATRLTCNEWLKEEAKKGTFRIIDSFGAIEDPDHPGLRDTSLSAADGAHLNRKGYQKLAQTALASINFKS